jgi:hypothetical protein
MATQFEPFKPKAGRACVWAILGVLCLAATIPAKAQEGGAIAGGVAALNSGKYDSAVRQLSTAIASSNIAPGEAAKALYLRGIAYRKMNQPARSISDLGAAMWLGLPPSDRLKAQVNRGLAYRAAGLSEQGEAELAAAKKANSGETARLIAEDGGASSNNTQIAAFSTEVRAADAGPSSTAPSSSGPGFASTVTAPPAPTPSRTADASSNWSTSVSSGGSTSAPPPPREEKARAPGSWSTTTTTDAPTESSSSGSSRVGRWINSWKGDSNSDAPPQAPESAPPPRATTEAAPRAQVAAPSSGWDAQTQIVTADARPAGGADSGSYTLQLTASRSQEEAQALYNKVAKQNPALASKQPDIQKTDLGGLGTFYRLQIGPFPDKVESLKLCNALKRSGVDCFLVTR